MTTIQLTRREAFDRAMAFLFCAIFVALVGPFDWIIGATFIDAEMRRNAISDRPHHAEAARVHVTLQPLSVLGTRKASVPKAVNREAGADPQADRDSTISTKRAVSSRSEGTPPRKDLPIHQGVTPRRDAGCAIPSPVSEGSEHAAPIAEARE